MAKSKYQIAKDAYNRAYKEYLKAEEDFYKGLPGASDKLLAAERSFENAVSEFTRVSAEDDN